MITKSVAIYSTVNKHGVSDTPGNVGDLVNLLLLVLPSELRYDSINCHRVS